jgi:hypothetical protein
MATNDGLTAARVAGLARELAEMAVELADREEREADGRPVEKLRSGNTKGETSVDYHQIAESIRKSGGLF